MKWLTSLFKKDRKLSVTIGFSPEKNADKIQNADLSIDIKLEQVEQSKISFPEDYTDGEIRQYIREIVKEAKETAKVETGYLMRSIRGGLVAKDRSVEFRQIYYGAEDGNSKLTEIATRVMPKDLKWKVILQDDEGRDISI